MAITDSSSKVLTVKESINVLAAKLADEDLARCIKYSDVSEMNKQEFIPLAMPWLDDDMSDTDVKISFDEETYSYVIDLYPKSDPSANAFDTSLYLYCSELPDEYSGSFCRVSTDNGRPFYINNTLGLHNGINRVSVMPFKNAIDSSYYSDNVTMVIGCMINVVFGMLVELLSFTKFTFVYHGSRAEPTTANVGLYFTVPERGVICAFNPSQLSIISSISSSDTTYFNFKLDFADINNNYLESFTTYTTTLKPYYSSSETYTQTAVGRFSAMNPYEYVITVGEQDKYIRGCAAAFVNESGRYIYSGTFTAYIARYPDRLSAMSGINPTNEISATNGLAEIAYRSQVSSLGPASGYNYAQFSQGSALRKLEAGYTYAIRIQINLTNIRNNNASASI